ncbi:MAG: MarR family transcriptional regulator [Gemmatimonadaceae bacterium]|nr:MarR family transcriptional regulator [Gemmatimonadaceae bacterium]
MRTLRVPQAAPPLGASPRRPAVAGVAAELDQLHRLAIALLRGVKVEDERAGVGPALLSALSVLTFGGPQSLGALARAEGVRPPTMSRLVDGLERAGLARRRVDPDDARGLHIQATARGRALLLAGRARRLHRLAAAADALTTRERARVAAAIPALGALVRAVQALPPPPAPKRRTRRRFD